MNDQPLDGRFALNKQQISSSILLTVSPSGTRIEPYRQISIIGPIKIFLVTPDFLLRAIEHASGSIVRLTMEGTYVGSASELSGPAAGEAGTRTRHLLRLDMNLQCIADGIQIKMWGNIGAMDMTTCIGRTPLDADRPHAFEVETVIRDDDLMSVIQCSDGERIAKLISQASRRHKMLSTILLPK